jgi:hypothetical protein
MPGAVPITSTYALTNATMPFVVKLAEEGVQRALDSDRGFMDGLNVAAGKLTYEPVARDQGLEYTRPQDALEAVAPRDPALSAASSLLASSAACRPPASSSARGATPSRRSSPRRA